MPDAYICGCLQQTKITREASDVAEYGILSCSVVSPEIVMHDDAYIGGLQRITLNVSCMMISGKEPNNSIYSAFTSDFLSFIDVELIQFFHGALQLRRRRKHLWRK